MFFHRIRQLSFQMLVALAAGFHTFSWAEQCPPPPMPLEQARNHIENAPAKNAGLLWRVEKDGRGSWLYGTMHLMNIDHAKPGSQIMMGLRSSDVLAVEINFYEPQPQPTPDSKPNASFSVSPEQTQRLTAAYQKECLKVEPFRANTNLLVISQAQRLGFFWGYGPDARLMQIAKRTNKPIVQLETVQQHLQALAPQTQADFDAQVNAGLNAFESGALASSIGDTAKAWQGNDLQFFLKATEASNLAQPEFMKRLNDERNVLMADKIDAMHTEGRRVFVAVGATHMTGPFGLPKLMEGKGYKVNFVPLRNM